METKGTNFVTNNGRQSDRVANYEDEYNDDAGNKFHRNEAKSEDVLQDLAAGKSQSEIEQENNKYHVGSIMDQDVLAIPMMKLLSAQEALEREVHKLTDVGKEASLFLGEPSESSINMDSYTLSSNEEFKSSNRSNSKNELEEEIVKPKIEVEVEYIAVSEAGRSSETGYADQMEVMAQQKKLAAEQAEMMNKVKGAENKAVEVKRQAEKLELILEEEEVWKLGNKVCRLSSCFTMELVLFLLIVYVFGLQFSCHQMEVVPT